MFEELPSGSLVAEAVMASEGSKLVIIVEGDFDQEFFEEWLDLTRCEVVPAHGKGRILQEIDDLLKLEEPVLVILDRDFDLVLGGLIRHIAVVYTDYYNLEATVLLSPGRLEYLWHMHARPKRGQKLLSHKDARQLCEEMAQQIGLVRLVSCWKGLELSLSQFPMHEVLVGDPGKPRIDEMAAIRMAIRRSKSTALMVRARRRSPHLSTEELEERCAASVLRHLRSARREFQELDAKSGHDVAVALRTLLRPVSKVSPSAEEIEWRAARAFPKEEVEASHMFANLESSAETLGFAKMVRGESIYLDKDEWEE
jgi:hypothetical protein